MLTYSLVALSALAAPAFGAAILAPRGSNGTVPITAAASYALAAVSASASASDAATGTSSSSAAAPTTTSASSSQFLPDIIASATSACASLCGLVTSQVGSCITANATNLDIATCSCSDATLTPLLDCVMCIENDAGNTYGMAPVDDYNDFVQQCASVNLTTEAGHLYPNSTADVSASSSSASEAAATTSAAAVSTGSSSEASDTSEVPTATATGSAPAGTGVNQTSGAVRNVAGGVLAAVAGAMILLL